MALYEPPLMPGEEWLPNPIHGMKDDGTQTAKFLTTAGRIALYTWRGGEWVFDSQTFDPDTYKVWEAEQKRNAPPKPETDEEKAYRIAQAEEARARTAKLIAETKALEEKPPPTTTGMEPWFNTQTGVWSDKRTGAIISEAPPGWEEGRGMPQRPGLPATRAPRYQDEIEAAELANEKMRRDLAGHDVTDADRLREEGLNARNIATLTQSATMANANREAENMRNRLTNQVALSGHMGQQYQAAVPYAMLPGQQFFLGAEPGGLYANIARMSGRSFDPNTLRPQPLPFDMDMAWRMAQQGVR